MLSDCSPLLLIIEYYLEDVIADESIVSSVVASLSWLSFEGVTTTSALCAVSSEVSDACNGSSGLVVSKADATPTC